MKRYLLSGICLLVLLAPPTAGPAAAETIEPLCPTGKPLLVGIFPRRNPALTARMFSSLSANLQQALQCPVRIRTAKDFPTFWRGVESRTYDLVHYNQYHYIRSADSYQVIARNEEFGSDRVAGAIYVRRDSGIERLGDLAGKRIVFGGGPSAMMSHIVPRFLLLEAGLGPGQYDHEYAPNPPNAVISVFYKQFAAAGAGDVVMRLPLVTRIVDTDQLKIIARSAPIAHLPWAVKRELPKPLKRRVQHALISMEATAAGREALRLAGLTGLVAAQDSDYERVRSIVERVRSAFPIE